jgi:hypothetical protein
MKSMSIKHTESGVCELGHPHATPGFDGRVAIYEITDIPDHVAIADVLRLFDRTCMLASRYSCRYHELGEGRIIRRVVHEA